MLLVASPAQEIAPLREKSSQSETSDSKSRNTRTGQIFEQMIRAALEAGEYAIEEQVHVGTRPNGRKHRIDLVATRGEQSILISLKWQQSSGTAEQKVPYEIICLSEAIEQAEGKHQKAYLVLGGDGWTLKDFYLQGDLSRHLRLAHPVTIKGLEAFVTMANQKKL